MMLKKIEDDLKAAEEEAKKKENNEKRLAFLKEIEAAHKKIKDAKDKSAIKIKRLTLAQVLVFENRFCYVKKCEK